MSDTTRPEETAGPKGSAAPRGVYDIAGLAELLGVTEGHVRVWRQRGRVPEPDFYVAGHPAWWSATVAEWVERLEELR